MSKVKIIIKRINDDNKGHMFISGDVRAWAFVTEPIMPQGLGLTGFVRNLYDGGGGVEVGWGLR